MPVRRITPAGRSLQRRLNAQAVLRAIRSGVETLPVLAEAAGISRTAAADVITDLLAAGWVTESSQQADGSRRGRPARTFRFNATLGYVAGLDIGAHGVRAMITDLDGAELAYVHEPVDADASADVRLRRCRRAYAGALAQASIDSYDVWSIGVASPGVIDSGVVRFYGGTGMPGWVGTDIGRRLSRELGADCVVLGDSASGTLGESRRGVATGVSDVMFVLAGFRTGAGYVIDGRVHAGAHGAAGLLGELPGLGWSELEAQHVQAAVDEDGERRLVDSPAYLESLARGIAAQVLVLDPELVVLGGGIAEAGPQVLQAVATQLAPLCVAPPRVELSSLGNRAVVVGAAVGALDIVESQVFPAPPC